MSDAPSKTSPISRAEIVALIRKHVKLNNCNPVRLGNGTTIMTPGLGRYLGEGEAADAILARPWTNPTLPQGPPDPEVLSIVRAGEPKPQFCSIEGDD